jgi:hypothetical protein
MKKLRYQYHPTSLNQRELRESIIRRDTYKLDRKKMLTNTVSSHVPSFYLYKDKVRHLSIYGVDLKKVIDPSLKYL